ncbi:MAG: hypothetical protein VYB35_05190, partial [Verrucomicrobiota bacterium]|nr:hypothetical protein [Verrucomicrobiota bacterium]
MHKLKQIFTFIAPYVKPYWGRLLAGLFFGVLFGASNGLVLWATKTLLDRLDPQTIANEATTVATEDGNWFTENAAAIQNN